MKINVKLTHLYLPLNVYKTKTIWIDQEKRKIQRNNETKKLIYNT